jgi:hypothetical protein
VTGRALEEGTHVTRLEVGDEARDDVLGELCDTDQGQGERDRSEVLDSRAGRGAVEPRDEVETLRVVGVAVGLGLGARRKEDVEGDVGEESLHEGAVHIKEVLELVEVVLRSSVNAVMRA